WRGRWRASRVLERLIHEHHRDVAHDRVDPVALDALQALLDDRLLAAELLAELVAHGGAALRGERHHAHLFLAERTRQNLQQLVDHHGFDVVHAHLTYDHVLARFIAGREKVRVVRTFHSRRVIRGDVFTRGLIRRTDALCVINDALAEAPAIRGRFVLYTPPPLDARQFTPEGQDVRAAYHLEHDALLLVA